MKLKPFDHHAFDMTAACGLHHGDYTQFDAMLNEIAETTMGPPSAYIKRIEDLLMGDGTRTIEEYRKLIRMLLVRNAYIDEELRSLHEMMEGGECDECDGNSHISAMTLDSENTPEDILKILEDAREAALKRGCTNGFMTSDDIPADQREKLETFLKNHIAKRKAPKCSCSEEPGSEVH